MPELPSKSGRNWFSILEVNSIPFKKFIVEITQKNELKLHKNEKTWNDPWCLQPQISQLLFGQISKVKTVLKSSLLFWVWPSRSWDIAKKQTSEFFWGHGVCQNTPTQSDMIFKLNWVPFKSLFTLNPNEKNYYFTYLGYRFLFSFILLHA